MKNPTLPELLDVAVDAAYLAGKRTLAYFQTGIQPDIKADNTPVTVADREAEKILRARILKTFPDHAILGEEEGETAGTAPYRWIVDPIDGTKSFITGVPFYGVLVGVEVEETSPGPSSRGEMSAWRTIDAASTMTSARSLRQHLEANRNL